MAAITQEQKDEAVKTLSRSLFGTQGEVGDLNTDDLDAAVQSIDDTMEGLASELVQGSSVAVNFNTNLPTNFKNNTTNAEKGFLLTAWTSAKFGV